VVNEWRVVRLEANFVSFLVLGLLAFGFSCGFGSKEFGVFYLNDKLFTSIEFFGFGFYSLSFSIFS
jgi:hypothetical protein